MANRGAEDTAPTSLARRNFPKRSRLGTGGVGSPALRLGVGGEGELHDRGLQGLPPPPSQPLCVTPRPVVTGGPASSPRPATVDGEGRFLGPEEMGERLAPCSFCSAIRGSVGVDPGPGERCREGRAQSSCGKFGTSVSRRPSTFGGVASRSLPFPCSSLTPHGVSCALPSRGGGVAPLQPQTHSFKPSKTQSLKKPPRS